MLIVSNSMSNIETLIFKNQEFMDCIKSEMVLSTQSRESFLKFRGQKIFTSAMNGIPNKSFGLGYLEQAFISNELSFLKMSNLVTEGIVFKYIEPWSFQNFFFIVEEAKRGVAAQERVKKEIDEMKEAYGRRKESWKNEKAILKEAYDAEIEDWKAEKKRVKEENKVQKEEWKEAYSKADENMRKYMPEPVAIELPPEPNKPAYPDKPEEPNYPSLPKVKNIREERLDNHLTWKILKRFRYCKVKGSDWGLLIKREEDLTFKFDNVAELEIEMIDLDYFYKFIKENDINHRQSMNIKQNFSDMEAVELVAETDDSFEDMLFSEESIEEIILPPLAPIKSMHAASMLAGGIGEFYKEVKLDGDRIAIKAAIVKELVSRDTILNGKQITETVETNNQKLGVYNLDDFSFKMLG